MYKIRPYNTSTRNRDLFDVFDNFFISSREYVGNMKIDVQDFEKEYVIKADLPGITKEDIDRRLQQFKELVNFEIELV